MLSTFSCLLSRGQNSEGTIQLGNYQFYFNHFYQSNQEEKRKRKQEVLLNNVVQGEHLPTALPTIAGANIGKEETSHPLQRKLCRLNSFNKWQQNHWDTVLKQSNLGEQNSPFIGYVLLWTFPLKQPRGYFVLLVLIQ